MLRGAPRGGPARPHTQGTVRNFFGRWVARLPLLPSPRKPREGVERRAGEMRRTAGSRAFGVEAGPVTVVTREHTWEFRYHSRGNGPDARGR